MNIMAMWTGLLVFWVPRLYELFKFLGDHMYPFWEREYGSLNEGWIGNRESEVRTT
jgi:hypothetical protein